jgi:homoserine kinase
MASRKLINPRAFHLRLPASSANLGPAFDAAALAFSVYLRISAVPAPEFSVLAHGRDAEICGERENHLILTTYGEILQHQNRPVIPLALRMENEIPIGKGCGSSAAARLAGIALANHFGGLGWNDARIIGEASYREHHPDNAAACWMGGLVVARMASEREAQMARIKPKGKWPLLLAVPGERLATEEARRALPLQYSRADVVANIQNSMLLVAAFSQGRRDLLPAALADRVHQPYRAPLCPLLPALQPLMGSRGIAGVALSGAGPAVLIFLDANARISEVRKRIAEQLSSRNLEAELLSAEIAKQGATSSSRGTAHRSGRAQKP